MGRGSGRRLLGRVVRAAAPRRVDGREPVVVAVTDLASGVEVDSSNEEGWCGLVFASGEIARRAAEWAAQGYLYRPR